MLRVKWTLLLLILTYPPAGLSEDISVPTVVIDQGSSELNAPLDEYSVFKVEKVSKAKLGEPSRQNLSDVVQDQVGVDSQVYCANCGAKRLTINGLKGEHTSILIDGLPLHSAVSSFYGVDNIPTNGLEDIQVMRGAGASLVNPEAVGGTLNLITVNPLNTPNTYSSSLGVDNRFYGKSTNHSLLYGWRGKNKKFGVLAGGQFTRAEAWDVDKNKVSEFPQRENYSAMAKTRFIVGGKSDYSVRLGHSHQEILGGYHKPSKPSEVRPLATQESDFEDGNTEKEFLGDPEQITDWVEIDRTEMALTSSHYLSPKGTWSLKAGYARQAQQAIYQHGFDYANVDNLFVADSNYKYSPGTNSIYALGVFVKDQRLRSASETLFEQYESSDSRDIKKDSFNLNSQALYGQYSYIWEGKLEVDLAVRADRQKIDWLELENVLDETLLSPRVQVLHYLTEHLTQRFSYGLGYRAPLTFFESQHGNNESGYEVDIDQLEKAHSLVYSLSQNTPSYYVTLGAHYTHLQNMAYGYESFNEPIQYRNSSESYDIWVADLLAGYKPYGWWLLEASFEYFDYEGGYKRKLPTAAIEQRFQLKSTVEKGSWKHSLLVNVIGPRNLSEYGSYNEHYLTRNQAAEPTLDTSLELKDQKSPTYLTVDTAISYEVNPALSLSFRINNLFDYTQAGEGDSPSSWHWHFNHAHYDGLHTWGPNTGRQFYLSLGGKF